MANCKGINSIKKKSDFKSTIIQWRSVFLLTIINVWIVVVNLKVKGDTEKKIKTKHKTNKGIIKL